MPALLVIVCSSLTVGTGLLALLRLRADRPFTHYFLALSSGLGVWMYFLLPLGYIRLFKPWILVGIAVVTALAALPILYRRREQLRGIIRSVRGTSFFGRMYMVVIGLIFFITFVASFAPVVGGIRNDEICLHLSIVRQWLSHGGFAVLPDAISYQAGNAHLLFLLAGAFDSPAGQRLVSWMCFVLCVGAVWIIARSLCNANNSIMAALIAAINPLIFRSASVAFIDVQSSLFCLLPVVALFQYRRDRRIGWIILCSIFLGAGAGIKPTNFIYGAAFCAASLLLALARRVSPKELFSAAAVVVVVGGVLIVPWPARNMVLTGSPVFPPPLFLYQNRDLKPLRGGPAPYSYNEVKGYYDYVVSRYGDYRRSPVNFLKFPWDITMNPGQFQIGDSIGTLFLSLFPCVLLLFPFSRILWFLLVMAGCSAALLYFLVLPEARYYIGVLLLLCPVLATAIQEIEKRKIVQIAVTTVVIVNCVFSLMVSIRILGPSMKAMASPKAAERMKRDHIPFYEAFDYLRRNNITDIVVFSAPQNLYYLPKQTRYRIDASLLSHGETLPGSYVLDIDRSQTLERNFALMKGDYLIPPQALPKNVTLVFQGPDARIYHFF